MIKSIKHSMVVMLFVALVSTQSHAGFLKDGGAAVMGGVSGSVLMASVLYDFTLLDAWLKNTNNETYKKGLSKIIVKRMLSLLAATAGAYIAHYCLVGKDKPAEAEKQATKIAA